MAGKALEVKDLMARLKDDLTNNNLSQADRLSKLEKLKIHGRDPTGADAIYSQDGIRTLGTIATTSTDVSVTREAFRCLANALFLNPRMRQIFIDEGFVERSCTLYKSESPDDEFLLARILFFTSYAAKKEQVEKWIDQYHLADHVSKALQRTVKRYSENMQQVTFTQMQEMALVETLKLHFSLKSKMFDRDDLFAGDAGNLFTLLLERPLQTPPLQSPVKDIINALSNLDLVTFWKGDDAKTEKATKKLVDILDKSIRKTGNDGSPQDFDDIGAPLIKVFYEAVVSGSEETKDFLRTKLLPSEKERDKPLGQGSSLPARLLSSTTSASAINTKNLVSALLFQLSHADPNEFVKNVGYGYASGYLISQGIAAPDDAMKSSQSMGGDPINPITGQRLSAEDIPDLPDMTDEEKEREAERLFVLFERLRKTGIIDVQNPIQKAVEEGRFEELD